MQKVCHELLKTKGSFEEIYVTAAIFPQLVDTDKINLNLQIN